MGLEVEGVGVGKMGMQGMDLHQVTAVRSGERKKGRGRGDGEREPTRSRLRGGMCVLEEKQRGTRKIMGSNVT